MASVCELHAEEVPTTIAPRYASWDDFIAVARPSTIRTMCHARTKKANAERLLSAAPQRHLTAVDVWKIMSAARGRCVHCGSFCVETLPYDGKIKLPWAPVGRRIGSIEHVTSRVLGGGNEAGNLAWACLWCNTWQCERRSDAFDHGGLHPQTGTATAGGALPIPWAQRPRTYDGEDEEYALVEEDDPWVRDWL